MAELRNEMEFINYAHRGASEYAPENTMASFALGCEMKANGVETDVQRTKDGVLVLFHDNDLMRICGRPEAIHDLTYQELLRLDFGIHKGTRYKGEPVPKLEDFLRRFSTGYQYFAIEIKEVGVEDETLGLIRRYGCYDRTIITSGIWQSLLTVHALDPDMKLGYLAKFLTPELLVAAKANGIFQICPKASILDEKWNFILRSEGFSVRAWGIDCEDTMKRMLDLQVDGMTINFPDVLVRALETNRSDG